MDVQAFLAQLEAGPEHMPSAEAQLEKREADRAAAVAANGGKAPVKTTALMEFIMQKRREKVAEKDRRRALSRAEAKGAKGGGKAAKGKSAAVVEVARPASGKASANRAAKQAAGAAPGSKGGAATVVIARRPQGETSSSGAASAQKKQVPLAKGTSSKGSATQQPTPRPASAKPSPRPAAPAPSNPAVTPRILVRPQSAAEKPAPAARVAVPVSTPAPEVGTGG